MAFSKQQLHKFADLIHIEIPDEKLEQMNGLINYKKLTQLVLNQC